MSKSEKLQNDSVCQKERSGKSLRHWPNETNCLRKEERRSQVGTTREREDRQELTKSANLHAV